jgi:hypothetical protein
LDTNISAWGNGEKMSNYLFKRYIPDPFILLFFVCIGLLHIFLCGCGGGGGGGSGGDSTDVAIEDISGTWYVAIGHSPRFTMDIIPDGNTTTFTLDGTKLSISGNATLKGNTLELQADSSEFGRFDGLIVFQKDLKSFTGDWDITGINLISGTLSGSRTEWPEYDIDVNGVPGFAESNCIELDKLSRISKFRSGAGHDYSDDFETCRSMKHYFDPKAGVDRSTIKLFSPVDGTIIGTTEEWDGPDLWKGTAVGIRPDGYDAFCIVIFHVDLTLLLEVGDRILAGEELGTSEKVSGTVSEISVEVNTPSGVKLVSFFKAMTDDLFEIYCSRGISSPDDVIITEAERDADPLICDGETFLDTGSLENYVDLTPKKLTRLPCGSDHLVWMQPYGQVDHGDGNSFFHDGIDFGSPGGKFFASSDGTVTDVEFDTQKGWPGTNYRIVIEIAPGIKLDYHFEIGGSVSLNEREANIFVSKGDQISAGTHIANLISLDDNVAHVHRGVYETGVSDKCPLDYFTANTAQSLEALYDSGIEKRPGYRMDLCEE